MFFPLRGVMKDTSEDKLEFIQYLDDLAACIGAKPSVPLLFLKDPRLAWEVFFGPCTPYQYRLVGPGKWDGARNAILTQWARTLKPLKTRIVPDSTKPASMSHYLKVWGAPILLASLVLICKPSLFLKPVRDNLQDRISSYLTRIWWGRISSRESCPATLILSPILCASSSPLCLTCYHPSSGPVMSYLSHCTVFLSSLSASFPLYIPLCYLSNYAKIRIASLLPSRSR